MSRKALIVGINYLGQNCQLSGCINDARSVKDFLILNKGFSETDIVLLTDDTNEPSRRPTRHNILTELNRLFEGGKAGDFYFFHYSGHGTGIYDLSGDEEDRQDECIVPVDYPSARLIVDDELRVLFQQKVPKYSKLVAVFDSCNSGTAIDLRFVVKDLGNSTWSVKEYPQYPISSGEIVLLSGTKDNDYSYDVVVGGKAGGALTFALLEVLRKNGNNARYFDLLKQTRSYIRDNKLSPQLPQLSFSTRVSFTKKLFPW